MALQRSRISQIVVRYLRTGTVTRAELCDIAMLPDQWRLVDFFAQRLAQ